MRIFVIPPNLFHVKRYNRTYRARPHSAEALPGSEPARGPIGRHLPHPGGFRVGLRIIGVWRHKRNSPSAYEPQGDRALYPARRPAVTYLSPSTASTSRYRVSRSCLPARLRLSGWQFYRSSPRRSLLFPDPLIGGDPFNPVAVRPAELAKDAGKPR